MFEEKDIKVGSTVTADVYLKGIVTGTVFDVSLTNCRIRVNFTDANGTSHWCYLSQIKEVN